ncbi:hypothetical protein NP493_864g01019 [Ridgeia piscesae]|uniref:E3 ubiquitin-protein ligase n=1 Tax=Ridgeia piscesae TaxID=27915 RepID=A0AAD9NMA9_RIDPI|nr:hypothetical protein NP493_864g01019 [Ridgeia piscesae]
MISTLSTVSHVSEAGCDEFPLLCQYLALPASLAVLFEQGTIIKRLVDSWCADDSVQRQLLTAGTSAVATIKYPMRVNHLIDLPYDYIELINKVSTFTCPSSDGDDSRAPALCLVCGKMLCSQSYCCQRDIDNMTVGAATAHAETCGAGIGIFLRVRECHVLLLFNRTKGCFVAAPYLDDYGETDQGLRRGNPLHLCMERYRKLQKLWLNHSVPEEIVHLLEANSNLMAIEWQHLENEPVRAPRDNGRTSHLERNLSTCYSLPAEVRHREKNQSQELTLVVISTSTTGQ